MCTTQQEGGIQRFLSLFRQKPCGEGYPGRRLNNVFRLPPSEHKAQAPAVATLVSRLIDRSKNGRVYLLSDWSSESVDYCTPLHNVISGLLSQKYPVTPAYLKEQSNSELKREAHSIKSDDPAVAIFCGYAKAAQDLLEALRVEYRQTPASRRPLIVMTDGCKQRDLNATGFKLYLTFPTKGIENFHVTQAGGNQDELTDYKELAALVKSRIEDGYEESIEMYGYDAMLILGEVAKDCIQRGRLGRGCMLEGLKQAHDLTGVVEAYTFEEGEHLSEYFVFVADGTSGTKPLLHYDPKLDVTKADIKRQLRSGPR